MLEVPDLRLCLSDNLPGVLIRDKGAVFSLPVLKLLEGIPTSAFPLDDRDDLLEMVLAFFSQFSSLIAHLAVFLIDAIRLSAGIATR